MPTSIDPEKAIPWLNDFLHKRLSPQLTIKLVTEEYPYYWCIQSIIDPELTLTCPFEEHFMRTGPVQSTLSCSWISLPPIFDSICSEVYNKLPIVGTNTSSQLYKSKANGAELVFSWDIFGFAFWMQNRLEEFLVDHSAIDVHHRYKNVSSHSYKYNYQDIPVVDYWICVLQKLLRLHWPSVQLASDSYQLSLSHDVDNPSLYIYASLPLLAKRMVKRAITARQLDIMLLKSHYLLCESSRLPVNDPYNTFDFILTTSEINNIRSSFNLMTGLTYVPHDTDKYYDLGRKAILTLISDIYRRGHRLGIHLGYGCIDNSNQALRQFLYLQKILSRLAINVPISDLDCRAHYLRFDINTTPSVLHNVGLHHDSSLGYSNTPGFRCGTSFPFPLFDLCTQKITSVVEQPLIVMESSIISRYGLTDDAFNRFLILKRHVENVNGTLTLLWHNCSLALQSQKSFYSELIHALS